MIKKVAGFGYSIDVNQVISKSHTFIKLQNNILIMPQHVIWNVHFLVSMKIPLMYITDIDTAYLYISVYMYVHIDIVYNIDIAYMHALT